MVIQSSGLPGESHGQREGALLSPQTLWNSVSRDRTEIPIVFTPVVRWSWASFSSGFCSKGHYRLPVNWILKAALRVQEHSLLLFSCSVVSNSFATPWTVTHQAPLAMGFPRQEVSCYFLLQGIFLIQGSNLISCTGRWLFYHWATKEACKLA